MIAFALTLGAVALAHAFAGVKVAQDLQAVRARG